MTRQGDFPFPSATVALADRNMLRLLLQLSVASARVVEAEQELNVLGWAALVPVEEQRLALAEHMRTVEERRTAAIKALGHLLEEQGLVSLWAAR